MTGTCRFVRHMEHTALIQISLCCRGGGAWPRSCSSLPSSTLHTPHTPHHNFLPLAALQNVLGTEQVPAVLHGLAAGQLWWRDRLCLELEELIQGRSAVPLPLGDSHPTETQLLVTISKNTPSTAALCKKERPQDKRFILLLPLNGHQATFCALLGARVWEQPCLGQLQPGQAD